MKSALALAFCTLAIAPLARGAGVVLYRVAPAGLFSQTVNTTSGNQTIGYTDINNTAFYNAILWSGPSGGFVNLTPGGAGNTFGTDTNGSQQVGSGFLTPSSNISHAFLWSGTAASEVDLAPTNLPAIINSTASGISPNGSQQVGFGYGTSSANDHALLWTGSPNTAVDLSPTNLTGFSSSTAVATDGIHQVGSGTTGDSSHALLWSGTANSAVDLHPTLLPNITLSTATGVGGNQQVGHGFTATFQQRALLWTGTANSAIDLTPTNLGPITFSGANDTNGLQQVGGDGHALLWSGSADSAVDLQTLLPASGTWTGSNAYTIDAEGDIFGIANGTFNGVTGPFAVEWSPIAPTPEPATLCFTTLASLALLTRRQPTPLKRT